MPPTGFRDHAGGGGPDSPELPDIPPELLAEHLAVEQKAEKIKRQLGNFNNPGMSNQFAEMPSPTRASNVRPPRRAAATAGPGFGGRHETVGSMASSVPNRQPSMSGESIMFIDEAIIPYTPRRINSNPIFRGIPRSRRFPEDSEEP